MTQSAVNFFNFLKQTEVSWLRKRETQQLLAAAAAAVVAVVITMAVVLAPTHSPRVVLCSVCSHLFSSLPMAATLFSSYGSHLLAQQCTTTLTEPHTVDL